MKLKPLADVELHYTSLESVKLEAGGQLFGTMEGTLEGPELRGVLRLVNLAPNRPDNVNVPTLRGILTTHDGVLVYVELNGISVLRESDNARVFTTTFGFRTADERYRWLNKVFGVLEGVLVNMSVARCRLTQVENDFVAAS